MSGPRLTLAIKDAIVADYRGGVKLEVIAEKYGVDQSYPGLLARRRGFGARTRVASRNRGVA